MALDPYQLMYMMEHAQNPVDMRNASPLGGAPMGRPLNNTGINHRMGYPPMPFMATNVQTSPVITGNPMMDMGIGLVAPALLNIRDPQFMPTLGPGVSPFEAMYAQNITTPLYNEAQQGFLRDMAKRMATQAGDVAANIGLETGVMQNPDDFRRRLQQAADNPWGDIGVSALMGLSSVQGIMGGDVNRLNDVVYRNRYNLSGIAPHPMDMAAQKAVAQRATNLSTTMREAIYGTDGGILPDFNFTRGFQVDEIGDIMGTMAQRGAPGMRGAPAGQTVGQVQNMTRVLASLRDLAEGGTIEELFSHLDQLTNRSWPTLDTAEMERVFSTMTSTAQLLNVSSGSMLNAVTAVGSAVGQATGIQSTSGAQFVAENSFIISNQTGRDFNAVMQEQTALMQIGLQSSMGRDITAVEFMRQQGTVSDPQYAQYRQALETGNSRSARGLIDQMFAGNFGTAAAGREFFDDPTIRSMVNRDLRGDFAGTAMRDIAMSQDRELTQRMGETFNTRMDAGLGQINALAGGTLQLSAEQTHGARLGAMVADLTGRGQGDLAGQLQATHDRVLAQTGDRNQAMAAVDSVVNTQAFAPFRGNLLTAADVGVGTARMTAFGGDSTQLRVNAQRQAGMTMLSASGADPATQKALADLRNIDYQTQQALYRNDTTAAAQLQQDAAAQWAVLQAGLSGDQRALIGRAEATAGRQFDQAADPLRRSALLGQAFGLAQRGQLDAKNVFDDQLAARDALAGAMDGFVITKDGTEEKFSTEQAISKLQGLRTIPPEQRDAMIAALKSGEQDKVRTEYNQQLAMVSELQSGEYRLAKSYGLVGTGRAILERMRTGEIRGSKLMDAENFARYQTHVSNLNQGMTTTLGQRIVAGLSGDLDLAGVLGIRDMSALGESELITNLGAGGEAAVAARDDVREKQKALYDYLRTPEVADKGAEQIVDEHLLAVSGLIGRDKDPGSTNALEQKLRASGLSNKRVKEIVSQVSSTTDAYRTQRRTTKKLTRLADRAVDELGAPLALQQMREQREGRRVDSAMDAILEGTDSGADDGFGFVADLNEGHVRQLKERRQELNEGDITALSMMTREEVAGMTKSKRQRVLGQLRAASELYRKQEGKPVGAGIGPDGKVTLTGTLTLVDKQGNVRGQVNDLKTE